MRRTAQDLGSVLFWRCLSGCLRFDSAQTLHLILDNFSIHPSRRVQRLLAHPGRIELHFLRPYSPEENRIEHLWKQLHGHVTRCHRYPGMPQLLAVAYRFLHNARPFSGSDVGLLRCAGSIVSGSVDGLGPRFGHVWMPTEHRCEDQDQSSNRGMRKHVVPYVRA